MKTAITALGAVTVLGLQAAAGTNLLSNPSFETPGPGVIPFADWTDNFFGNIEYSTGEIAARTGDAVCKMYGTFPGPGVQGDSGLIQRVDVTPGQAYDGQIYVWQSSADPLEPQNLCLLVFQWKDVDGNGIDTNGDGMVDFMDDTSAVAASTMDGETVPADEWIEVNHTDTAPATAEFLDVLLIFIQFDNGAGALFWDDASIAESSGGGCNDADLAEPFGTLDLNDITAFASAFVAMDDAADIAEPFGTWDLSDVTGFVSAFLDGCP